MWSLEFVPLMAQGVLITSEITFSSFIIGALLAFVIATMARAPWGFIRGLSVGYVELLRAVPPLPWLFLAFFGLPELGIVLAPIPASIAVFSLIAGAYLSEIYKAGMRAVPTGQWEASQALGLGRTHTYRKVIIPQAVRTITPLALAYLLGLLKDSAIASVLGVLDISGIAVHETRRTMKGLEVFTGAALLYLMLSIPVALSGRWMSGRLHVAQGRF